MRNQSHPSLGRGRWITNEFKASQEYLGQPRLHSETFVPKNQTQTKTTKELLLSSAGVVIVEAQLTLEMG